ncbi:hypothetical protein FQN60_012778 [Etheostoma spectabile]|uniref:Uncharacterized protein n=1 Tax=Etheostoma spectabile TaxID=54343 RepID=A0A5J5D8M6_9PERO|nr:hypothetical protein FQN60_012778 [Etheostoma spectabile]
MMAATWWQGALYDRAALVSFRRSRRRAHKKDRGRETLWLVSPSHWGSCWTCHWVDHGGTPPRKATACVTSSKDLVLGTWLKAPVGPQRRQPPFVLRFS